jgi:hypothetical protein
MPKPEREAQSSPDRRGESRPAVLIRIREFEVLFEDAMKMPQERRTSGSGG